MQLPRSTLQLPRLLSYVPDLYKTKWEKFAEERGIKKVKKRSRLVWSEEVKDWVPRWGKNSLKKVQEDLDTIRVVKTGDDSYEDSFKKSKTEKKASRDKQELQTM